MSDAIEAIVYSVTANETKAHGLVRKVTLILPNDGDHPFQGMTGQRIAIACARIHDNEKQTAVAARPTDGGAPQASGNGGDKPRRFHSMTRAQQAGIRCDDPAFRSWLANRDPAMWKTAIADEPPDASQDVITARLVRALCGVKSRAELDTDPTAGRAWDALNDEFEAATGRRAERMW